jgi:hypothetical protein
VATHTDVTPPSGSATFAPDSTTVSFTPVAGHVVPVSPEGLIVYRVVDSQAEFQRLRAELTLAQRILGYVDVAYQGSFVTGIVARMPEYVIVLLPEPVFSGHTTAVITAILRKTPIFGANFAGTVDVTVNPIQNVELLADDADDLITDEAGSGIIFSIS